MLNTKLNIFMCGCAENASTRNGKWRINLCYPAGLMAGFVVKVRVSGACDFFLHLLEIRNPLKLFPGSPCKIGHFNGCALIFNRFS